MNLPDSKSIVMLCNSLPIHPPTLKFNEADIKKMLKTLLKTMDDDEEHNSTFNFSHSYFVHYHSLIYYIFIGSSAMPEGKFEAFYLELKKDLGFICKGKYRALAKDDMQDGYY